MINMTTATVTDFKANVSAYLSRVELGDVVVITSDGKVKARVIPDEPTNSEGLAYLKRAKALREKLASTSAEDDWKAADYIRHSRR